MARDTSNYRINGVRIPSVTEVLKIAGMTNFDGIPAANLLAARERVVAVHTWTEAIDLGTIGPSDLPLEDIEKYVFAWISFKRESGFTPTLIECPVVNEELRYAGTLDRRGEMNGKVWTIDIKCTYAATPVTGIQTCAYDECFHPRGNIGSVLLKKDGSYRFSAYKNRDYLSAVWHGCLEVAHFLLNNGLAKLDD